VLFIVPLDMYVEVKSMSVTLPQILVIDHPA